MHRSNLMWPWWIDIAISTVGVAFVGLATIRLIVGHYTREIRGD